VNDDIIVVDKLSKSYTIGHQAGGWSNGLRHDIEEVLRNPFKWIKKRNAVKEEFHALQNVSFTVKTGEVVGIIGRNGAGKSTLLKILSRITEPTAGRIEINGRVASLLEVGTGFHGDLTGRENIFLNGAILGMTKVEIKRKFDEIVAFSEIEKFLDTPVKRYSSGMYMRLAFAVAAHLEPEILIVDEVLAVGDAAFQKKCLGKMQEVSKSHGRTVLFVSHNMGAVASLCKKAFWLKGGKLKASGEAKGIVQDYLTDNMDDTDAFGRLDAIPRIAGHGEHLKIVSIEWLSGYPLQHGTDIRLTIRGKALADCADVSMAIGFSNLEGVRLLTYDTDLADATRHQVKRGDNLHFEIEIRDLPVAPGIYNLDLGVRSGDVRQLDFIPGAAQIQVIPGKSTPGLIVRGGAGIRLPSNSRIFIK
jgi:lipopolysaccharide transport system ATP-binding protein